MSNSPSTLKKDSTFEYKVIDFFTNQWQTLVAVVLIVILFFGGVVTYQYFERSKEKQAQAHLYVLQKAVQDETKKLDKDQQAKMASLASAKSKTAKKSAKVTPPAEPAKTPAELAQNYGPILNQYTTFIQKYRSRKASYMAAIQAASLAEQYKDYKRAETILKMVVNRPGKKDLFWGLLKGQYAGVLIHENNCAAAVPILRQIADNKAHSFFQAHALLRLGACYIKTKNYNRAEDALVRVQTDFPRSEAAFEAHELKRLIMVRKGQKS